MTTPVLLLEFGGPEEIDEVVPFLERMPSDAGFPPERLVEVGQHYFTLGGVSPLNAQNRALRTALAGLWTLPARRSRWPWPIGTRRRSCRTS